MTPGPASPRPIPEPTRKIGAGCVNSTGGIAGLALLGAAVPTVGQPLTFQITNAPPNTSLSFVMPGFNDLGGVLLDPIGMVVP